MKAIRIAKEEEAKKNSQLNLLYDFSPEHVCDLRLFAIIRIIIQFIKKESTNDLDGESAGLLGTVTYDTRSFLFFKSISVLSEKRDFEGRRETIKCIYQQARSL